MRPNKDDFQDFLHNYVDLVEADNYLDALKQQQTASQQFLRKIPSKLAGYRYAEGKWTINEVVSHVVGTETWWCRQAVMIANMHSHSIDRKFERYDMEAMAAKKTLRELSADLHSLRNDTIEIFENLNDDALDKVEVIRDRKLTLRAIGFIIPGHEKHHLDIINSRYLSACEF